MAFPLLCKSKGIPIFEKLKKIGKRRKERKKENETRKE